MKIKTEKIFSNYKNYLKERRELNSIYKKFKEKTKQCATEYVDLVEDCEEEGFTMAFDKRPINFFPRLYYITYETNLRILPYDTKPPNK